MTTNFNREGDSDLDELADRVSALSAWKERMAGGLTVAVWFIGILQVLILAVLSYGVSIIGGNVDKANMNAVGIEGLRQRFAEWDKAGPRFTPEMNAASDAALRESIIDYVSRNYPPTWLIKQLEDFDSRVDKLENK